MRYVETFSKWSLTIVPFSSDSVYCVFLFSNIICKSVSSTLKICDQWLYACVINDLTMHICLLFH